MRKQNFSLSARLQTRSEQSTDVANALAVLAKEVGALSFVDAVHYAAHNLIDVKDFDCDFLACSAYKFYGPHIGILYGAQRTFEKIDFPKLKPAPDYAPERVETGTQNHESIAGAAAAVDFLASLSEGETRREKLKNTFSEIHSRKNELIKTFVGRAYRQSTASKLYGQNHEAERTPTIAFTVKGLKAKSVSEKLAARGIFTSHGDFYALTVVQRFGLENEGLVAPAALVIRRLKKPKD